MNTTGWVLGGVGAALLIAGIAVRPNAKSKKKVALLCPSPAAWQSTADSDSSPCASGGTVVTVSSLSDVVS